LYDISLNCGCNIKHTTKNFLRRCVFTDSSVRDQYQNQNKGDYFQNFMSDIITARYIIFCFGFLVAIILSFVYAQLLRSSFIATCLVWSAIGFVLALTICLTALCWKTASTWEGQDPREHGVYATNALKAFSLILLACSVIYLCLMVFLCRQINLAIKTVSLAATAIQAMPLVVLIPIFHIVAATVFMIPCMFYMFNIASQGEFTTVSCCLLLF
jgi:hypothetical protein